jgi:hypothetical protein
MPRLSGQVERWQQNLFELFAGASAQIRHPNGSREDGDEIAAA